MIALALLLAVPASRDLSMPIGKGTTPATVQLDAPAGGWSVDRMVLVKGSVSDVTIDPVVVSLNGDRYLMRTFSGAFARKFPAAAGRNVVTVIATNKGGTAQAQASCYANVPAVPLKAVLTSDTDGVYTDLHIYEPTTASEVDGTLDLQKMSHVFWANTASPSGGTFFLNNQGGDFDQPGYGPYLYIHRAPPQGVFMIATNYWPSGDKAHTVAMLDLTLFEGTANETRRKVRVPLATPGTTKVLAWVRVGKQGAQIYVPGQDPLPGEAWPKNLDEVATQLQKGEGGGEAP
jgi:uncharacterized protein YfaP (DUF2135 family)